MYGKIMVNTIKRNRVIQAILLTALFEEVPYNKETASRILCERVALAELKFRHLDTYFNGTK
jgi:hypothetical protein